MRIKPSEFWHKKTLENKGFCVSDFYAYKTNVIFAQKTPNKKVVYNFILFTGPLNALCILSAASRIKAFIFGQSFSLKTSTPSN